MVLSLIISSLLFYLFDKWQTKKNNLERVIRLAYATDAEFTAKIKMSKPGHYLPSRDIPFSLIVEKQGHMRGFREPGQGSNRFPDMLFDWQDEQPEIESAKRIFEEALSETAIEWERVYKELTALDQKLLRIVPTYILNDYQRAIYFARVNFLEIALPRVVRNEPIVLGQPVKGEEPIHFLLVEALNSFYEDADVWIGKEKPQISRLNGEFNREDLKEYLAKIHPGKKLLTYFEWLEVHKERLEDDDDVEKENDDDEFDEEDDYDDDD